MKYFSPCKEGKALEFAEEAAKAFRGNPTMQTYTKGEIEEFELFAVRWNTECVLVFIISDEMEPTLYEIGTEQ